MTETQIIDQLEQEVPTFTPLKGYLTFLGPMAEFPIELEEELAAIYLSIGTN